MAENRSSDLMRATTIIHARRPGACHSRPRTFIKRKHARRAGKPCESILLVQGKRVPAKRPVGRPWADSGPPKSAVLPETLANLSRLPAKLIEMIDEFCRDPQANRRPLPAASSNQVGADKAGGGEELEMGPGYGVLAGLHGLARE